MQVILLERLENYGHMGEEVRVKDGFARNYLLPQKKALRANAENRKYFESRRKEIEAANLERKGEAEQVAGKLAGKNIVLIRQAGDTGQLYGSVSTRDIGLSLEKDGMEVKRNQIVLDRPIKTLGVHDVRIVLHGEVSVTIQINVARSEQEAELQAKGVDVDAQRREEEAAEAQAQVAERAAAAQAMMGDSTDGEDEIAADDAAEEEEDKA